MRTFTAQADYCVFEGEEMTGWPVATWLRGEHDHEGQQDSGEAGLRPLARG